MTKVLAGVICALIYFFFAVVFSAIIFSGHDEFGVAEGACVVLAAVTVGCLVFARFSGCRAVIAGPDLLPIIFVQAPTDIVACISDS